MRSLFKGCFVDVVLFNQLVIMNLDQVYTYSRNSTILPQFVGKTIFVHNGLTFYKVYVLSSMVGHKLGEFSLTKKRCVYKIKKKKKK